MILFIRCDDGFVDQDTRRMFFVEKGNLINP